VEVIRKPQPKPTETISVSVIAGQLKKDAAKARDIARKLKYIDMPEMVTKALSDVFETIIRLGAKGQAQDKRSTPDPSTDLESNHNGGLR
jgi:hypothetical protein